MQTEISGEESVNVPIDRLKKFITDSANIAKCIPDSKDYKKISNSDFSISIDAGISVVRGTFKFHGTMSNEGNSYTYMLSGKGLGSDVKVTIAISLSENAPDSTAISWKTTASFTGIISGVSEPIIKKVTYDKVKEITDRLKVEISSV